MELKEIHPECGQDLVDWDARFQDRGLDNPYQILARDYEARSQKARSIKIWILTKTQWGTLNTQKVFLDENKAKKAFQKEVESESRGSFNLNDISEYEKCFSLRNGYQCVLVLRTFDVPTRQ